MLVGFTEHTQLTDKKHFIVFPVPKIILFGIFVTDILSLKKFYYINWFKITFLWLFTLIWDNSYVR